MRVIMTTIQPGQTTILKYLPLKQVPIVTAVTAALPNVDASLEISALIAKAFTINNNHYQLTSHDQRYQLRVKMSGTVMEIIEISTLKRVYLQLV